VKALGADEKRKLSEPRKRRESLARHGRFPATKPLNGAAVVPLEKSSILNSLELAKACQAVAATYEGGGNYAQACSLYRRSLLLLNGPQTGKAANSLRMNGLIGLGSLCVLRGRYRQAEQHYRQARSLALLSFGRNSVEMLAALNGLGVVSKYVGHFGAASRFYNQALAIAERSIAKGTLGPDAPELASLYHNLGGLEHSRGRFARAEPFARWAVEIRERVRGPAHPEVAADVAALAPILDGLGNYRGAEKLYKRALTTFRRTYGPCHYEIAVNMGNLAANWQAQGKHKPAERLYRAALAMLEQVAVPRSPDVALLRNNLGKLLTRVGRPGEAVPLLKSSLVILTARLAPGHPHLRKVRKNLRAARQAETRRLENKAVRI
jgi:tetratricopeptide (TPR) repeat protein